MSAQLPLGLQLRDGARFDNFVAGPNATAVAAVQACAAGQEPSLVYLWGASGSGRSHLLQAACRAAAGGGAVVYLPLGEAGVVAPAMTQGLEHAGLVCIDDLDAVAGESAWEQALFGLINGVLERSGRLLVSARTPPAECALQLPDLRSRLSLSAVFHLQALDDGTKVQVLQQQARARGFELPDDAAHYLLRHSRRDLPALLQLLARLDRASLAAQRRLTVPFVREVLARDRSPGD